MGIALRMLAGVPYPVRRAIERTLGADSAFVEAEPEARRRYHERVAGSVDTSVTTRRSDRAVGLMASAPGRGGDV